MKHNNEMNLIVLDADFARDADTRIFDADIAQSRRITHYDPSTMDIIDSHIPVIKPAQNNIPLPAN
jgi:hypothetical protein